MVGSFIKLITHLQCWEIILEFFKTLKTIVKTFFLKLRTFAKYMHTGAVVYLFGKDWCWMSHFLRGIVTKGFRFRILVHLFTFFFNFSLLSKIKKSLYIINNAVF